MESAMSAAAEIRRREEAVQWLLCVEENPPAQERARFETWLADDPANRAAFDGLNAMLQNVECFSGAPEVVSLRSQSLATARRSHELLRARAFLTSRWGKAAGAAFLTIVCGIAGYYGLRTGDRTIQTTIGERRMVALADGSHASLDAATELDVDYSAARRRVVLERGRAKFDVAKDPLRPFTVEAGGKVVVAVGTSFSVELVENQVRVALYEGRVEVLSATGAERSASPATVLEPGHELIAEAQQRVHVTQLDPQRSLAWETGDLAFTDELLPLAVDRINRYSERPVRVADEAAAQVRVSGVFHAGDTDAFIDGVTMLFPLRAERRAEALLLFHAEK